MKIQWLQKLTANFSKLIYKMYFFSVLFSKDEKTQNSKSNNETAILLKLLSYDSTGYKNVLMGK